MLVGAFPLTSALVFHLHCPVSLARFLFHIAFQLYVEHEVGVFLTVFSCHSTVCRVVSCTVLEMESKLEQLEFEVSFNQPGDGDCFYSSAAKALGIPSQTLKNVVFDYLRNHQFDVSIYSLLWYDKDKSVLSSDSDQL